MADICGEREEIAGHRVRCAEPPQHAGHHRCLCGAEWCPDPVASGDQAGTSAPAPGAGDVDAVRDLLDLMENFPSNDQRARYLLSSNWLRGRDRSCERAASAGVPLAIHCLICDAEFPIETSRAELDEHIATHDTDEVPD